jgi:hypothetical protein
MSKSLHNSFMDAFEGRVLRIERHYNLNRNGHTLALLIFVPDYLEGTVDELEIYRRVAKVVNVISPREGA